MIIDGKTPQQDPLKKIMLQSSSNSRYKGDANVQGGRNQSDQSVNQLKIGRSDFDELPTAEDVEDYMAYDLRKKPIFFKIKQNPIFYLSLDWFKMLFFYFFL